MVRPPERRRGKSQHWLTFLRNHLQVSWAMDFFTVPTLRFQVLYVFLVLNHSRRRQWAVKLVDHPRSSAVANPWTKLEVE
jgi:hypothetical protein